MNKIAILGDVNLMGVTDPEAPFRQVISELRSADLVFCNLECLLAERPEGDSWDVEGFFADPKVVPQSLKHIGAEVVGMANNVTYGADAIMQSISVLDGHGIAHTGAGADREAAAAPVVVERNGQRIGFTQRSFVYWATNHEAGRNAPGIAAIRGHTAYQVPMYKVKREIPPLNRPGIPPYIRTWVDEDYKAAFEKDLRDLRAKSDIVIASFHWGLHKDVLEYMTEIAHAAIDAGADAVVGHGPHYSLGIEVYKGKPIYYGLGSYSFGIGHGGHVHDAWIGMQASLVFDGTALSSAGFRFVRRNADNETVFRSPKDEPAEFADIETRSNKMGASLEIDGDDVRVVLK